MGRLLVLWRLAAGDLRRHRGQALLVIVMVAATTTTLTLAVALRHPSSTPFDRTRALTRGPDVIAELAPGARGPLAAIAVGPGTRAGVRASAGPFPLALASLSSHGVKVPVQAEGRDQPAGPLDRPLLLSGSWVHPGAVVLENALAKRSGIGVGDTVRLNGRPFRVSGLALSTAQPFYPARVPGSVWLTRQDVAGLVSARHPPGYVVDLRLDDPAGAEAFLFSPAAEALARRSIATGAPSLLESWQSVAAADYKLIRLDRKVMTVGSWLLLMLALASIAVAIGGRIAEQTRRIGVLKAVGARPALIASVLVSESILLGAVGAGAGVGIGSLLLPSLADPGPGLLGNASPAGLGVGMVLFVLGIAVAVAATATLLPALRGARRSTLTALHASARPPRRHPWLVRGSVALPAGLLLGMRLMARRVKRTVFAAAGLMISVAMVVVALTVKHDLQVTARPAPSAGLFTSSVGNSASHVLFLLSAVLVVLAAVTVTFSAWATVLDAQRPMALARALGATPRQLSASLAAAQLVPALVAACLGIPAGLGLFELAGGHLSEARPPLLWLLAVIPGALLTVAALTAVPARLGARRPVAEVLRSD